MNKSLQRLLCAATLIATSLALPVRAEESVGLVLAGGGARGIAHAGVIKALEEMQVPVHGIAGTSMGALVGGLYAIGMDADDLYRVINDMDWEEAFEDSVDRGALPPRRKSDDYDYPSSIKLAFKDGEASIPLGIVQGQQTRQIIKDLMLEADQIRDFDQLPTPYRAVATDIETGNAYIFSEGDIVTAMRASMSLPALLAPVEHDGRLLVDGGLAMNIPVEVGRDMGAGRLIVIDIGTPLKSRDEIRSVIGVADQMLGFLTRRNSEAQLATLGEEDILIRPDLDGIGMLSFEQADTIYQRGYDAAMALRDQLEPLAVDEATWAQHLASRELQPSPLPVVDYIAVNNNGPISDDVIRARIRQPVGATLDRDQLRADIATVYALDYWEIIDYELTHGEDGNGLLIHARAKTWGDDTLKLGLNLVTDMDGSSEVNIGGSYLLKGVTDLGGEVYGRAQLGDTVIFSGEFYQPLDLRSRFFVVPYIGYTDHDVLTLGPEFDVDRDTVGNWRVRRLRGEVAGGMNLFASTQARLGLFRNAGEYKADAEIGGSLPEDTFQEGGVIGTLRWDRLDNPFFPTRGSFLYAEYEMHRRDLGADHNFERWQAVGQAAWSFGQEKRNTLIATARSGQSIQARNEPQNYFQLGGLFNLSGAGQNLFSGRQMAFAMAQYQRRLSDTSVLPVKMPAYVGASIEGGQLWSRRSEVDVGDFMGAGSIYLAVDSPIGPIYFAYGRTEDSLDAIYLSLGWPFLSNQLRMGR